MSGYPLTLSQNGITPAMESLSLDEQKAEIENLASDLQDRCTRLLEEVEQFEAFLKEGRKSDMADLRRFKSAIIAESKATGKVSYLPFPQYLSL